MNSETFMSLINRAFLIKQLLYIIKHKTTFNIKIKNIKFAIHDNSKYVILNLYMSKKYQENSATAHFKTKFHIINEIKINMLIKINVMKSKRINLNFENKIIIIFTCKNIQISINFHRKKTSINRTIWTAIQITMSIEKIIIVSVRIKSAQISKNRNYNFFSKMKRMLKSKKKYFVHVTSFNLVAVQIKNILNRSYIIFKNFKMKHLRDFDEKNCFMISFENSHLAMTSNQIMNVKTALKSKKFMKTTLFNEITMYENEITMKKLQIITEKTSKIWCSIFKMINLSSEKWMKIRITDEMSKSIRMFRISSENKTFINKKFDVLHEQNKLKWTKINSYVFSIFVIWNTMHLQNKESQRKNRIIIDIKELNKMSKFDVYFMFFQFDIISVIQDCKFISIMNCAVFFHQWRMTSENRHKLIIVSHKNAKQWNVTMMKWKDFFAYVQKKMNEIFKNYSYVRVYIDNVIVFSSSFEKHLRHFSSIFAFFQQWNITLKIFKTYFEYFSIFLLSQKIDSFDLATTKKKLKIITKLFFSAFLKTLKKYIEMTEWFKNYVPYYAQKSKTLQRKKTKLLKNDSVKNSIKKNFNQKILLKNFSTEKLQFYEQLQKNFSRLSWLTHFDILKQLYADIDVSKDGFDVMIYHVKNNSKIDKISDKRQIKSILFFSKFFTEIESKYWSTKLKMTTFVWTIRRIVHMIRSSKHFTVIYIDHEANFMIVVETKLSTTNINKLNMKLIKTSIYFFQFRIEMRHKLEKFNIVSNVLNRLSIKSKSTSKSINSFDIDAENSKTDLIYAYVTTLVEIFFELKKKLIESYAKNSAWKKLKSMLKQLKKRIEKKHLKRKNRRILRSILFWKTISYIMSKTTNGFVFSRHAKKRFLSWRIMKIIMQNIIGLINNWSSQFLCSNYQKKFDNTLNIVHRVNWIRQSGMRSITN